MTETEDEVIRAAVDYVQMTDGARYVPIQRAVRRAHDRLKRAVDDLASERDGEP